MLKKLGMMVVVGYFMLVSGLNALPNKKELADKHQVAKVEGWIGNVPGQNQIKGTGYFTYADWNSPAYLTWGGAERGVKFVMPDFLGLPPVTIDTVTMEFYEHSSYPWPDSTFHIVIYGHDGTTVLYTSPDIIAHRYPDVTVFVPSSPITITDTTFYIMVVPADTSGFPSLLSDDVPQMHSFYRDEVGTGDMQMYDLGELFIAAHGSWTDISHDVTVSDLTFPDLIVPNDTFSVTVSVLNRGTSAESFDVTFQIFDENNAQICSYTTSVSSLAPGSETDVTFDNCFVTGSGVYTFTAFTSLDSDQYHGNDTLSMPVAVASFVYDFEATDGGFVADPAAGAWEWGAPASGPSSAHSGQNLWGTVLGGNYPDNADFYLYSSSFVATDDNPVLSFWQWYSIENHWDGGNVAISTDSGNTWTLIEPEGGYPDANVSALGEPGFTGQSAGWEQAVFVLNGITAGTEFMIRFHFASDVSVNYPGWYIDDLSGTGFQPIVLEHDVAVTDMDYPGGIIVNDTFNVDVSVYNNGQNTEDFDVAFEILDIDRNVIYSDTMFVSGLTPDASTTVTFGDYSFSEPGTYIFHAQTLLPGDEDPDNDVMEDTVLVAAYSEDFEATNGRFDPDPMDGWQWGVATVGPSSAHSGQNLWGTVLDGNYPNGADFYLYSPLFVATEDNPVFTFWQWYDIESGYDGGNLAISTDGGNTWTLIEPEGGYPDDNINALGEPGYTGHDARWEQAVFVLDGITAGTEFMIRFHFGSDGSVNYPGWYIDDVSGIGMEKFVIEHDVMPTLIDLPPDMQVGIPFDVNVYVTNGGENTETFDVRLLILDINDNVIYDQTQTVTNLEPSDGVNVTYSNCTIDNYGAFRAVAITLLPNDVIPENDTLMEAFSLGYFGTHAAGPDAGGYYFIDSNLPLGPAFNWIEPEDSTANLVSRKSVKVKNGNSVKSWDDGYLLVPMPFPFTFYGNTYDTVYVSTNGYLSFGQGYTTYSNRPIPYSSTPNNIIALMWDDLRLYADDSARIDTVSGVTGDGIRYFVIEFENVDHYGGVGHPMDFEVILYENGDILIQYNTLGDGTYNHGESATVGIENEDGTIGLQYLYDGDPVLLHDSLAILFTTRNILYHDVALDAVLEPVDGGHYIAGQTIDPVVRVVNTGFYPEADTFEVGMNIYHGKSLVKSYAKTVTLLPGDTLDVTLPSYTIPEAGDYTAEAYVAMAGDGYAANDTATVTFDAEGRDAYVSAILTPSDTVLLGTLVQPTAEIVNGGTTVDTIEVTLSVPSLGYTESEEVEAAPGETLQVVFPDLLLDQPGEFNVTAYTEIEYDLNPSNDTLESTVYVAYVDAGVDSIINPLPATYSEGDTFTPVVRVHNYSNVAVNTPVVVEIWRSYAKSKTLVYSDTVESYIDAESYEIVTMSRYFALADSGYYDVNAFTLLENDMDNTNDSVQIFFSSFVYRDIAIDNIVAPVSMYNIWETVVPEAVVHNYGTGESTFDVGLEIFYEGNLVAVDSVMGVTLPANGETHVQFSEFQFNSSGNYTFRFTVIYPEDMDTTNNTMSMDVFVAAHDIALTEVVEPSGNLYDVGTWIYPAIMVVNRGNIDETFDVVLNVMKNGAPYVTYSTNVTVEAGSYSVVTTDSVLLDEEGVYEFDYSAEVTADTATGDNEISTQVNASYHDVSVLEVLGIDDIVYHVGDNIPLTAVVSNNKLFDENVSFNVTVFNADSVVFTRTMNVPLAHNSVDTVDFTIFTVPLGGFYMVKFKAMIANDHDTTNNCLADSFAVPEMELADSVPMFVDTTGNWQFGQPTAPEEPAPFSGENLWGTMLGGNYPPDADWVLFMSDWMDVTGDDPVVIFEQWFQFGAGDGGWIEVELGDGSIQQVYPIIGSYNGTVNGVPGYVGSSDGWQRVGIMLGDILTEGDSFRLMFHFHSDGVEEGLGWYIDNLQFVHTYQRLPNDVAVRELWAPTAAQPLYRGQLVNLWTTLSLTSNTPSLRTFRVIGKVFDNDGVLVYSASAVVRNLQPGATDTVFFSPGWIPFEVGTYRFVVTVYNLGDPNISNNVLATNIVVQADKGSHEDNRRPVPRVFALSALAPNPFSSNLNVTFSVPRTAHVKVLVYDAQGRLVNTLVDGQFNAGYHSVRWDGSDANGSRVSSGVYFVKMQADGFSAVKRVVLLK